MRGSPGFSPARLRAARQRAGMTPAGLSRAAGLGRSDISKYEAGQASPQPPRLAAIAGALGIPPTSLLESPPGGPGLAYLRAASGLTQEQLADRAGIGLKRYELAELGLRRLSDGDIICLAEGLGATAREVLDAHRRDTQRSRDATPPKKGTSKSVSDTLQ